MRHLTATIAVLLLGSGVMASANAIAGPIAPSDRASSDTASGAERTERGRSFGRFLERYEAADTAFLNGDPRPWLAIATANEPASIFGGFGGLGDAGVAEVLRRYQLAAGAFQPSGAVAEFEYLVKAVEGRVAYTVAIERAARAVHRPHRAHRAGASGDDDLPLRARPMEDRPPPRRRHGRARTADALGGDRGRAGGIRTSRCRRGLRVASEHDPPGGTRRWSCSRPRSRNSGMTSAVRGGADGPPARHQRVATAVVDGGGHRVRGGFRRSARRIEDGRGRRPRGRRPVRRNGARSGLAGSVARSTGRCGRRRVQSSCTPGFLGYVPPTGLPIGRDRRFRRGRSSARYVGMNRPSPGTRPDRVDRAAVDRRPPRTSRPDDPRRVHVRRFAGELHGDDHRAPCRARPQRPARARLYVTDQAHHSVERAAHVMGLAPELVTHVPTNDALEMDIARARAADRAGPSGWTASVSGRRQRRDDQHRVRSTRSGRSSRWPTVTASGCTSTARTAASSS